MKRKICVHLQIVALCTALGHIALVYIPLFMFAAHNVRRKRCVHLQIGALCTAVGHMTLFYVPLFMFWCSYTHTHSHTHTHTHACKQMESIVLNLLYRQSSLQAVTR